MQFAAQPGCDRRAVAKVKNNLYYAFGYNVFLIKRMSGIHLPYTVNGLLKTRFVWYVMVVIQITVQLLAAASKNIAKAGYWGTRLQVTLPCW